MSDRSSTDSAPDQATAEKQLELLAPAGDWAAMEAALDSGATAVYFGLTTLNARRRAKNFRQDEFAGAVQAIHAHGARAYLTLNIDLSERDLGQAVRILELARQCGVDVVLVRDPALLAFKPEYPGLEFHFSTQTCTANSADVAAARDLGAARVVLAREMTIEEIAAASAVPGIETEVFAQGALCFSVSGRCLLSSWAGGRSGNRGACTSPCRVPWTIDGQPVDAPLSMRDLATMHRLGDLRKAGVAALKIEGRLKNAAWVRQAVELYRRALAGEDTEALRQAAAELGSYTGRELTCGYLDSQRGELTGLGGREAATSTGINEPSLGPLGQQLHCCPSSPAEGAAVQLPHQPPQEHATDRAADQPLLAGEPDAAGYELEMPVGADGIACHCRCGERSEQWRMPRTVVRRPHKAVAIDEVLDRLADGSIQGYRLERGTTNDPEFLLVPRAVTGLVDRISAVIRLARKTPDQRVRIDVPESVRDVMRQRGPATANRRNLGEKPDRVRLHVDALRRFLRHVRPGGVIVEGMTHRTLKGAQAACGGLPMVVALPPVFFEEAIRPLKQLLSACAQADLAVEVNSWGGWRLARKCRVRMEGGPGLAVLNSLAARVIARRGITCVTLSPEADRRQFEELTAHCPVPCSLVVYGRPALMITRVQLPEGWMGRVFEDRRGLQMVPRLERGLSVFRPVEPFDLRGSPNERIRACHLVVDLIGSEDLVGDWQGAPLPGGKAMVFRFNYDRTLA